MLELVPGRMYRRRELHEVFGGQRQGGISTPSKHPVVLLFTGEQGLQHGYEDHFHVDGTFWYTGEGQRDDMQMIKGNRAIKNHAVDGKVLHLFEYTKKGDVRYCGRAVYLDHHKETRPDTNGKPREAIVFELLIENDEAGEAISPPTREETPPAVLWKQPFEDLRKEVFASAEGSSELPTTPAERKRIVYFRSARLKAYVIRRAKGACEGCTSPAPFKTRKNKFYLEPHHIRRVADGGRITPAG